LTARMKIIVSWVINGKSRCVAVGEDYSKVAFIGIVIETNCP